MPEREPQITEMIDIIQEIDTRMRVQIEQKKRRQRSKTRRSRLRRAVRRLLK